MAKQKKSKGKKTKKALKEKPSLSHLEKETLYQRIADLKSKIEWRSELCDIIKDNIKLYEKAYEIEGQDKRDSVNLLEETIKDHSLLIHKVKSVIPDAKNLKTKAEEIRSHDMALNLVELNKEALSNEAELQVLRKKVADLESYDVQLIDNKIKELEEELSNSISDQYSDEISLEEDLSKILRSEMQDIYKKKISAYQGQLKGKMNKRVERILEEARWWRNSWHTLLNVMSNLKQSNTIKSANLDKMKDLKIRKEASLLDSSELYKQKNEIFSVEEYARRFRDIKKHNSDKKCESVECLDTSMEKFETQLKARQFDLKHCYKCLEINENHIKELESDLSYANNFGDNMSSIIKQAIALVEKEVKRYLEKNYNDPPEKTNILPELDYLFTNASKLIYESM